MNKYKMLFIHNGAMGDRILTWPLMRQAAWAAGCGNNAQLFRRDAKQCLSGCRTAWTQEQGKEKQVQSLDHPDEAGSADSRPVGTTNAECYFLGPQHNPDWQAALGYRPAPAALALAVDGLYNGRVDPALRDWRIIWPVLDKKPFATPQGLDWHWLEALPTANRSAPAPHVTLTLLEQAARQGIIAATDPQQTLAQAQADWRHLFGGWPPNPDAARNPTGHDAGRSGTSCMPVSLIPGAGGTAKQWPMDRFVLLSRKLCAEGLPVRWILGPAERERGLAPPAGAEIVYPLSLDALSALLLISSLVIANDSGPAHLAAMHGVPLLALFGPTDPERWQPLSGQVLKAGPLMEDLGVDTVWEAVAGLLAGS